MLIQRCWMMVRPSLPTQPAAVHQCKMNDKPRYHSRATMPRRSRRKRLPSAAATVVVLTFLPSLARCFVPQSSSMLLPAVPHATTARCVGSRQSSWAQWAGGPPAGVVYLRESRCGSWHRLVSAKEISSRPVSVVFSLHSCLNNVKRGVYYKDIDKFTVVYSQFLLSELSVGTSQVYRTVCNTDSTGQCRQISV